MTVVVDEMEVVPAKPAPPPAAREAQRPPHGSTVAELERALVRQRERALRLEAH